MANRTHVYSVHMSVILSLDGDAQPITKEIIAENVAAWLDAAGDDLPTLVSVIDSYKLIDSYEEA